MTLHPLEQIKTHTSSSSSSSPSHTYTILLVPRRTELCRQILEDEGVLGDVKIEEFNLNFIPLENDVLSLELEHAAKEIFLVSAYPLELYISRDVGY